MIQYLQIAAPREMLYRNAKVSFVRDAAILVGVVCGGIFLYKNGAVIADGFQNIQENMEPLEKRSADAWAALLKQKAQLNLWGELPPGEHQIGDKTFVGGDQRHMPLTDHPVKGFTEQFVQFLGQGFGVTGKTAEESNFRDKANSTIFASFSTLAHDRSGVRDAWKRNSKQMVFHYHTKWSSANIEDKRGPICRYDLLAFLPRRDGKRANRHFVLVFPPVFATETLQPTVLSSSAIFPDGGTVVLKAYC